jgi:hypothetical protein
MKIPVFVSSPTSLSPSQEAARTVIIRQLDDNDLEARALGPTELPLREVLLIARHGSGGIILGFEQFRASGGLKKRGTPAEEQVSATIPFPTPWNHLESGILFGLHLPTLVFREDGHRRYIRYRRLRCFHSSYAATKHQRRCEGCSEVGISEMGGQGFASIIITTDAANQHRIYP